MNDLFKKAGLSPEMAEAAVNNPQLGWEANIMEYGEFNEHQVKSWSRQIGPLNIINPKTKSINVSLSMIKITEDVPGLYHVIIFNPNDVDFRRESLSVTLYHKKDFSKDFGFWSGFNDLLNTDNSYQIQTDIVETVVTALGGEIGPEYIQFRDKLIKSLNAAKSSSAAVEKAENKWAGEFNKFDQRLKAGDEKVINEIVNFYNGIINDGIKKWEFYKWLQNHQSALAAKVMPRIGLCWEGIVPELTAIVKGESGYGNPYAAARQLHELFFQGTIGGLEAPQAVVEEAQNVWRRYGQEFMGYVYPLYAFLNAKFSTVEEGKKTGKLVIVRHVETSWSEAVFNKWAGWLNSLITSKGRTEAKDVGGKLTDFKIDLAYSSDLSRARDTLSEFLAGSKQEGVLRNEVWDLREKSYGALAGWSRQDVQTAFGDKLYNQWLRATQGRAPLGENLEDTKERVGKYLLEEILPAIAAGKNVVISAHGNSLRSLLVILREHTSGKMLSDKEIEKLEVPLSVPIAISFDNKLNHTEMWSNQHSPAEILAFLQASSSVNVETREGMALKEKKDEFSKLLAEILGVIEEAKQEENIIDRNITLLGLSDAVKIGQEISAILEEMDSVSDLNGLREKVHAAIVKLISYIDSGSIDKEIGKLKELYASLNANILADKLYKAGLKESLLKEIALQGKPIEKENNFKALPGSYYMSRYHLLAITVEGADYLVKVSHDEDKTDYKNGRRPRRIVEFVPKDTPDTREPLIRFRVFADGITPEISFAGHKEPKKKDGNEPNWKEAKRKSFAGLFNENPQEVDRFQELFVAEVNRVLIGASSSVAKTEVQTAKVFGGIDFRQMNILIQPQGSFASSSLDFSLPDLNPAAIESFDLDTELAAIQRMASSGIAPSDERLKEYLAVCFARGRTGQEIDELKLCLEDIFTAQQLEAKETPDGYKEVLVIADTRRFVVRENRLAAGKGNAINLN